MSQQEAFRYTPGDGHVYKWNGGEWITIEDIVDGPDGRTYNPSTRVIRAPAKRTATALMAAVDAART